MACGMTIEEAALYVGCSPRTITNTIRREPEFEDQIRQAHLSTQTRALRQVMRAGENSWRAAAWFLERTNPHRYAYRNANFISRRDHVLELERFALSVAKFVRDEETLKRISGEIQEMTQDAEAIEKFRLR